jgi:NAD(P)H-hydrate repair Nnr-like enzyme with NAD(P)H-hydrate dehydratase domain
MSDVVLDAHGLTVWAARRPSSDLLRELEACQRSRGVVIVPTVAVAEGTFGDPRRDALVNRRIKAAAADAAVTATALQRGNAVIVTSDPGDLHALCSDSTVRVVGV